jgi:glutamate formiminotransferase
LAKIKAIADAARKIKAVKVLDVEWDESHNRSLVTVVGQSEIVFQAAFAMIKKATELIDMEKHQGEHPRIGATDVVPFIPVSGVSMQECVDLAQRLGKKVATELKIPVYLYEAAATRPERVNLADIRKGEYEGLKIKMDKPDYGPNKLHPTAGAMIIGARKYLIAFNVNLETSDVAIAKKIAAKIREKDGGLAAVKALGFKVGGHAQVSMNLVDYEKTNFDEAYRAVEAEAKKLKVKIKNSEIYGMVPLEALVRTVKTTFKADSFKSGQVLEKRLYE